MIRLRLLTFAVMMFSASIASAQKTGDLKIQFKLKGNIPNPQPIKVAPGIAVCGGQNLVDESLVVDADTKGIANIIVYVYTGSRGGTKLPKIPPGKKVHTLANKNCRFEPHALVLQAGETLNVTNPDPVGHNCNFPFLNNVAVNLTIPAGQQRQVETTVGEPAPTPVACNIHPWMNARVLVLDHPFGAVSDKDGVLVIKDIPVGKDVVFRAYHERGTFKNQIFIKGKKEKWKLNRFELDIKPGINDMGVVEVPATEL